MEAIRGRRTYSCARRQIAVTGDAAGAGIPSAATAYTGALRIDTPYSYVAAPRYVRI
ncbi:hypothetical protein ACFQJD_07455 [Haloplanus sp. GCM10025708]|uniref:hypothetical protein n=1 Tax=Haloferacaceae TaxID=1644056 RepID=UPI00361AEC3A